MDAEGRATHGAVAEDVVSDRYAGRRPTWMKEAQKMHDSMDGEGRVEQDARTEEQFSASCGVIFEEAASD